MIEIDKKLVMFSIRHVVRSYMLSQGWGIKTDFYGWSFSMKEWEMLEEHIKDEKLPSGYYDLCDIVNISYSF